MNETNLTPRQTSILNCINQSQGLTRGGIQEKIEMVYAVSKPTLVRDLDTLLKRNLIRVVGKGKNTIYTAYEQNPILRFFDLTSYFQQEPDRREGAKKQFDFDVFEYLTDLLTQSELNRIHAVQKRFSEQIKQRTADVVQRELERFVIELSWKSSKIEGNTYTLLETERLIKQSQEATGRTRNEAIMILNHKKAFEQILAHAKDFRQLSVSDINQLHNTLVRNLGIRPGIRVQAVGITGTVYQPLDNRHQLAEAMERFIHAVNTNPSPIEKALVALAMISYIQPYTDGNKRTARMLTNAILLAHDYYPLSYRSVDENEFKQSLILFYEQGSIAHLKRLFIDQAVFAFTTYFR